ncbi:unnamed protein product [Ilex paraguariensis]|uniref:Uncharacterized protein n=1 Tax=Ilex paraguariensis TaxID=185542 RepID=A0ABC8TYN5_9AQUA
MDVGTWCQPGSGNISWIRNHSMRGYYRFPTFNSSPGAVSKAPIWRLLWRKLKRKKKRVFDCSSSARFTYDPYSYAQNFDQGLTWADEADADDLSRSFSARFAVPSRIFQQDGLMV